MECETPHRPRKTDVRTNSHLEMDAASDTLALLRPHVDDAGDIVHVDIEGGKALGIVLDEVNKQTVIKAFTRHNDAIGPVEQNSNVHVGDALVAINGKDVSKLGLKEVGEILKKLKDRAKVLGSGSPTSHAVDAVAINIAPAPSSAAKDPNAPPSIDVIAVRCPPGPLGLLLNSETLDRAIVIGFQPLPDGSQGVLEMHDNIRPGAVLVRIDGEDVSAWTLDAVKRRLGELADQERTLEFTLPRHRANSQDYSLRRKEEFTLMKQNDSTKIERGECWLVVDAKWVERWVTFAALNGPPPGPITNETLVQPRWEERLEGKLPGDADQPREHLKVSTDYRCVTPLVYAMDIYGRQLPAVELKKILKGPSLKAEIAVKEIKHRCQYAP
ncbi:hypothetical protein DYB37_003999 [Aphanomyces astaci]|uniref:DUSP domain-containing protein n=1 Tax=Aphanomyces astaci TaxID=112090 RepID=A0A397AFS7_APHAT|nr:hypothetical protein DYB25_004609 [Aphanomyces astaci]RHY11885.1 hypothetical protein DYB36_003555 [Aphanomyces astaci]RHY57876.1 hypothetical protein DYB38_007002 [Aphanomyces astaci]RHY69889.1 hypothetical protein DYB34_005647 [Aphanomyces astaci]RHY79429.1 hypothetical protein DYB30_004799 [Aphanomyces astaci]